MNIFSLHSLKKYILSILVSFLVTFVFLGVVSLIFSFFPPVGWLLNIFCHYSIFLTVLLSAFLSAKASSGQGLMTGITAALLCLLTAALIGFLIFKSGNFPNLFFRNLPIGVLCGGAGGILGVNSK